MFQRLFAGAAYPLEGLKFINAHGLWRVSLWIMLLNVVVFAALVAIAMALVKPLLLSLGAYLTTTFAVQSAFAAEMITILTWIAWAIIILAVVGLSGVSLVLVGQALASPFLDALSENVEELADGTPEAPLSAARITRAVLVGLSDLVWGTLTTISVYVPLVLLGLIPVIGTLPATIASYVFGALLAAHEFMGLPLTRRFVSYRVRWRIVRENSALMLGFGAVTVTMLVVPLAGFFMLPIATVGGTLLFSDLRASGQLDKYL